MPASIIESLHNEALLLYLRAYNTSGKGGRPLTGLLLVCDWCNDLFWRRSYRVDVLGERLCSKRCEGNSGTSRMSAQGIKRPQESGDSYSLRFEARFDEVYDAAVQGT